MIPIVLGLSIALVAQVPAPGAGAAAKVESLNADRELILRAETLRLESLADREAKAGRSADADAIRALIERSPGKDAPIRIILLPEIVPARPTDLPKPGSWQAEVRGIRVGSAKAFAALALKAAARGTDRLAFADRCLRAAIARDPDHPEARRLLGYIPFEAGWATPGAVKRRKEHQVFDSTYGWVPDSWLPKLAEGLLPGRNAGSPWLPKDQADALRSDIDHGWQIRSAPHFRIQADVPLAEAIAFGRRLEALQDVFFAVFADVLGPNHAPIAARLKEKPAIAPIDRIGPFEVFYFASRSEYVENLERTQGRNEEKSLGLYLPPGVFRGKSKKDGRSFFYRDIGGPIEVTATLYHEASHQLLFESAGSSDAYLRNRGNYWIWEGLGTYFETMSLDDDGSASIGAVIGPRIASARAWMIDAQRFVPISKFVNLDAAAFNREENKAVYVHYAESMALTLFLMQFDGGRYRDAFLDYVADGFDGKLRSSKELENRLGVASETLDGQFLKWLEERVKVK